MSSTVGIVIAAGAISMGNQIAQSSVDKIDWITMPVATGLAAIGLNLAENLSPDAARLIAWTLLVGVLVIKPSGRNAPMATLSKLVMGK
jgi:hypothetical protein